MSPFALPIAELKPALTGLAKVISRHSTLPVLHHIKIERTGDGWVGLTATDLDQYVTVRLEQPAEGGPVTLLAPLEELAKLTKTCAKTDSLLVCERDSKLSLQYAVGNEVVESLVDFMPADEFPNPRKVVGDAMPVSDALRSSIHQAMECASTDETRYILNGAYIDISDAKCQNVVATDGRHLFTSNSFTLPLKDSLLIPDRKFLGWKEFNNDGEWQLKVGPKEKDDDDPPPFQISSRRWRFISRQITGNYPNWRQVVPRPDAYKTALEFDAALDQISQTIPRMPCDDPVNFAIGLEWKRNTLRLLGRSPQAETWTKVEIPEVKGTGADVTIYLNRHLLVKALQFGLTKLEIIDSMSPMRFSNEGRQMIVMPTRPSAPTAATAPVPESPEAAASQAVPDQPAAPAAQHERKPMPEQNGNTGTSNPAPTPAGKSALEIALAQLEVVRGEFRNAHAGLARVGESLKAAAREQKASDKEISSVRQTLRQIQAVRI